MEKPQASAPHRSAVPPPDMAPLVASLGELSARLGATPTIRLVDPAGAEAFEARTGFRRRPGPPVIVVGQDVALELGHPDTESQAQVVWTAQPGLVTPGRVTLVGPDLGALARGARCPYGLVVGLELDRENAPDPFGLEQLLRLTHRLPGYMVRALPGRLWARLGAEALTQGLSLLDVGEALVRAYTETVPGVRAVEALLVTQSSEAVRLLAPLVAEARILAGRHKRLALSPEGDLECDDLDCERCDDRETCDALRDILARRRSARREGRPMAPGGDHG